MMLKRDYKYFVPLVSVILAILTAMSPLAIDTYLPAMPDMATAFKVGMNMVQLTITMYFLGFALGNFIGGPLSDSFGRKPVAITGIILYGISALLIPLAPRIEYIWLLRFTQAFGGGFGTVTAMVFVKDWFEGRQVARMATIIGMIMMLAPLLAPIIGTLLMHRYHWQGIFWFLSIFALLLLLLIGLILTESRKKEFITRELTVHQLIEKYIIFFRSRKAVLMLLVVSFSSAGMFVFITAASFMYISYFGLSVTLFPVLFGSNIVLHITLSFLNARLLTKHEPENLLKTGMILQLLAGTILLLAVLLQAQPTFAIVFGAVVLFVGALGLIFGNATAIILNLLPEISGSANATIGVTRFVVSFVVSSIPALFPSTNIIPIGITMFGCTFLAFVFMVRFRKEQRILGNNSIK